MGCYLLSSMQVPTTCSGVPTEILNPASQWKNKGEFDSTISHLADLYLVSRLCLCPALSWSTPDLTGAVALGPSDVMECISPPPG